MAESFPELADSLFLEALTDANMTGPDGLPLFDRAKIDVALGGAGAINGESGQFTLPLPIPMLTIDTPIGPEHFFSGYAPDGTELTLVDLALAFTTWSNDGAADAAIKQRLMFARDRRKAVFSAHGLTLLAACSDHLGNYLVPEGLYEHHYVWHFHWSRSSG